MSEALEPEANADIPEDFHPYVRLLVIRMRSHPEEFHSYLLNTGPKAKDFMTPEEQAFVWKEERRLVLEAEHEKLMHRIMQASEPVEEARSSPGMIQGQGYLNPLNSLGGYQQSLANAYNQVTPSTFNALQAYNAQQVRQPQWELTTPTTSSPVITEATLLQNLKKTFGI